MSKKKPFPKKTGSKSGFGKNQSKKNQDFPKKFSQKGKSKIDNQEEKPDLSKLNDRIKESKFLRNLRKKTPLSLQKAIHGINWRINW